MSVVINSNVASLQTQRQLSKVTADVSAVYQRLSSGLRINHASDDSAGLAIASDLNANKRIFTQGVRNLNDGLSLLSIADSSVEQLTNIVTRLKELSEQAANGTYGVAQRKALDSEAQALSKEYTRLAQSTKFNSLQLFSASFGQMRVQGGIGANGGIVADLGGAVGTGSFDAATSSVVLPQGTTADGTVRDVVLSDINADGKIDMISAAGDGPANLVVQLGRGDGTFGASVSYLMGVDGSVDVIVDDFNNDGILDAAMGWQGVSSNGSTSIRLGNGDGTFRIQTSYTLTTSSGRTLNHLVSADLNNDGNLDLVATLQTGIEVVQLGTGTGSFAPATSFLSGGFYATALADFNRDGNIDLALGVANGDLGIFFGNGNGTFLAAVTYIGMPDAGVGNSYATSLAVGDLNGDGILDIVNGGYDNSGSDNSISVILGNANGTFRAPRSYVSETNVNDVTLGDINGDGNLDLINGSYASDTTSVRLGNGDGSFAARVSYHSGNFNSMFAVALGDLNGDGVNDLVSGGYDSNYDGKLSINLGKTTTGIAPLDPFKLTTRANALQALTKLGQTLTRLTAQRGKIGAFESRISTAVNTLRVGSENFSAASSRIMDADVAEESANLVRGEILQQAANAVLAQANQQPSIALVLLNRG